MDGHEIIIGDEPELTKDEVLAKAQALRRKVIFGRVVGVAIGLAIWWFVIRPTLGDNPLVALVTLGLVTFGGQYYGTMVVWSMVGGKR